ncbi:DUF2905 domain-containing protein [Thermobacillus sp. ZCTH02-B1]|uniref:DUF2905 domain-containing protein n=1 Tax=Thermobacillus sp. ZCTH02-B1 TaxID=1858795 RepID=UPI0025F465D3|nr:DUF2905 domain-containing protein [Thermobacillus sp. ZCTH02-B1]
MPNMPKLLMAAGAVLFLVGLVWMLVGKSIPLGRLPGDIAIEKENFRFYFPIVTCIVISIVLSAVLYLVRLFMK